MENIKKHVSMLGHRYRDCVTGFQGVASSVSFDLYGCQMTLLNPGISADGKMQEQVWFDSVRLEWVAGPVMPPPDFESRPGAGKKGPAEKPVPSKP